MTDTPFEIVPFNPSYSRATFNSASEPLNQYLRERSSQDIRRRIASCFVALTDDQQIAGYYTVASASLPLDELPASTVRKMPRYPTVPAIRMGRLAVDQAYAGRGLGAALLGDALQRSASAEIAAFALIVDAKDEAAAAFYRHHGFVTLPEGPLKLFFPLTTVVQTPLRKRTTPTLFSTRETD